MLALTLFCLWGLILAVLHKSKMHFFKFIVGSVGLFCFTMYVGKIEMEHYLETAVTWGMWVIGRFTGLYTAYPGYSMITVYKGVQAVSFFVDYECSGLVETLVFICLVVFYPVYRLREKAKCLFFGTLYIFAANIVRVFIICAITKVWGNSLFFFSHTVFARLLFFALMVVLYYYVFTRPHIIRQKVGNLNHDSR